MYYLLLFVSIFSVLVITCGKEFDNKLDRYLFACRSTDLKCFQRQYKALRNNVLLGNEQLNLTFYEPYIFRYGDSGTCVKISGVEDSELLDISMDSNTKQYLMVIELPIKIQQVINTSAACVAPDKEFKNVPPQTGALKKFSGNATFVLSYPYTMLTKKDKVHMLLGEENLDVVLDIADLSQYDKDSELETKMYEWSEWAYDMVQHIDVALHCIVPFSVQLRKVMERLPLEKFISLYPGEEYSDLHLSFGETVIDNMFS